MTNEEAFEILNRICNEICSINMDCLDSKDGVAMKKAINALEQTRWIPVSERLPEKNGDYICTIRVVDYYTNESGEYKEHSVFRCVKVLNYQDGFPYKYNVIAWMPLPEAYKEAENDD